MNVAFQILATTAELIGAICRALAVAAGSFERSISDEQIDVPGFVPDCLVVDSYDE